jgi:hypothetical protein
MKQYSILAFVFVALILLVPVAFLGENAYVIIHDNLDSELVYLQMLKLSGQMFGLNPSPLVPNVMNGIERGFFHSEFSFIRVLFYIFPPFWAYTFNSLLVRAIGFWGVVVLGRIYFMVGGGNKWGLPLVAAMFALMPIYSIHGATIMAQPFLLWAFLNLLNNKNLSISFLVIVLFPFYAHFALIGPFSLVGLFLLGAARAWRSGFKNITPYYWIGVGLLLVVFMLANFNLIFGFLKGGMLTHRLDWHFENVTLKSVFIESVKTFFQCQYHAANFLALPIYILLFLGIFRVNKFRVLFLSIAIALGFIALFNGCYPVVRYLLQDYFSVIKAFNFNRFTFLMPILWLVVILAARQCRVVSGLLFNVLMLAQILLFLITGKEKELAFNYAKLLMPHSKTKNIIGFRDFFAEDLFHQVDAHIGKPKSTYRVVSLGLHPSVAQFNGFYTLDGYMNNYPLSYKRAFRPIISEELAKDEKLKQYFDGWGSRCYLFSDELYRGCYAECRKEDAASVGQLEINTQALRQLGGAYIISTVSINNADEVGLQLEGSFSNSNSVWQLQLYRVE